MKKSAKIRYINRELSWLEFNQRVLDEAIDSTTPLLERLKFLAITAKNLDEFMMVRVGGLHLLREDGMRKRGPAGMTPRQQLLAISQRAHRQVEDQYACFIESLEPALRAEGICRLQPDELTAEQRAVAETVFDGEFSAILSPMAIVPGRENPLLGNLGLHLAVRLPPADAGDEQRVAVIPVGHSIARFVRLPQEQGFAYMTCEDLIRMFVDRLFPGEKILESVPFRITRNANMSVRDEFATDLMVEMEAILKARKVSACVRLEIDAGVSRTLLAFFKQLLGVSPEGVYEQDGPLDLGAFMQLDVMDGFEDLKFDPWSPQPADSVDTGLSMFENMTQEDLLFCHPFEQFDPVVRLVQEAADDPQVLAVKQILYRTSSRSPIVAALKRAAENGKYVTVIVELKARFDEARNIEWARDLEHAGVQVVYGVKGLKTHAKLLLVVRKESRGVVRYVHFGTGNYNESTARLYTDISYLTTREDLAADASAFFNSITGYSEPRQYLKLAAAPLNLRSTIVELIDAEAERARHGERAEIMAKLNSLVDPATIEALYRASAAGVKIRMNVRGICCLRPGVKGLSENIEVVSIIDRFLEHSRIFYFRHGGPGRILISSADWMIRNLDRRAELLVPVDDKACRKKLLGVLRTCMADTVKGRRILPDGSYAKPVGAGSTRAIQAQRELFRQASERAEHQRQLGRTRFTPHQPVEK